MKTKKNFIGLSLLFLMAISIQGNARYSFYDLFPEFCAFATGREPMPGHILRVGFIGKTRYGWSFLFPDRRVRRNLQMVEVSYNAGMIGLYPDEYYLEELFRPTPRKHFVVAQIFVGDPQRRPQVTCFSRPTSLYYYTPEYFDYAGYWLDRDNLSNWLNYKQYSRWGWKRYYRSDIRKVRRQFRDFTRRDALKGRFFEKIKKRFDYKDKGRKRRILRKFKTFFKTDDDRRKGEIIKSIRSLRKDNWRKDFKRRFKTFDIKRDDRRFKDIVRNIGRLDDDDFRNIERIGDKKRRRRLRIDLDDDKRGRGRFRIDIDDDDKRRPGRFRIDIDDDDERGGPIRIDVQDDFKGPGKTERRKKFKDATRRLKEIRKFKDGRPSHIKKKLTKEDDEEVVKKKKDKRQKWRNVIRNLRGFGR